jgi:hypothetical protein
MRSCTKPSNEKINSTMRDWDTQFKRLAECSREDGKVAVKFIHGSRPNASK